MAKKSSNTKSSIDTPEARVVYIHGIGKKPRPDVLRSMWDLALFGRDMGNKTRMAYWADRLHGTDYQDVVERSKRSLSAGERRINGKDVASQLNLHGTNADRAVRFVDGFLSSQGYTDAADSAPERRGKGKKVLLLPRMWRKPIARLFLESFIKDTAAYFFQPGKREEIQQCLRDVLPKDGKPFTLVAHSQGTIVTLEVLASLGKTSNVKVDTLVTLGSPLGIEEVQDFVQEKTELKVPACVGKWFNFSDPFDPVALDKSLSEEFMPEGFILDDVISNRSLAQGEGFDPHSAIGYLAHPSVRNAVYGSAKYDSRSRFVVARDVAMSMASPRRQPVLVELVESDTAALSGASGMAHNATMYTAHGPSDRNARAAEKIRKVVGREHEDEARIDVLDRFVAARLTAGEITQIATKHREIQVHTIWKSSSKRKLLNRSSKVIHVDAARHSYGAEGSDITWAVLDTGVNTSHPHFKKHESILQVWDCTKVGPPRTMSVCKDPDGHGTHVCGIIAGTDAEGLHVGMAPKAKLIVYKVLDDAGNGEDAWIIKALDHIAAINRGSSELKVHGLNLSLGGSFDATVYGCGHSPICQELRRRWREGVVVCIAAGNEGQTRLLTGDGELEMNTSMTIGDPANLEEAVVVGSVHADKPHLYGISAFSSRGPTLDGRVKPDIVAPGERIASCNTDFTQRSRSNDYVELSGTSMASPHVSGLLAAFLSIRREFIGRPDEVKALLKKSSTDIGRDIYHQGAGVPNLMKMLLSV